jgi:hypothetical protein
MELYFGRTHHIVPQFLACKKKKKKEQLELQKDVGIEFHVEIYLKKLQILPFTS